MRQDTWLEEMYAQGLGMWLVSFRHGREGAFERALSWLASQGKDPKQLIQGEYTWTATKWAENGFPMVEVGAEYASALMSTRPMEGLRPPWDSFGVSVPPGFYLEGEEVRWMWVSTYVLEKPQGAMEPGERWAIQFCPKSRHSLLELVTYPLAELLARDASEEEIVRLNGSTLSAQDLRTSKVLVRLALNLCLAMSNPEDVKRSGPPMRGWHRGPAPIPRSSKEPVVRTYVVGKPTTLDLRGAVRDYIVGKTGKLATVQVLVRGHWKKQVCGVGRAKRKVIWVEPYWKGPEDAPILVRPHVLPCPV